MAQVERSGVVVATWLRRNGARTLQRSHRTISTALRQGQYPGGLPDDTGAIFSLPAAPGAAQMAQTASRDDAEEPAASPERGLDSRGISRWRIRERHRRAPLARGLSAHPSLQRQGLLRSGEQACRVA